MKKTITRTMVRMGLLLALMAPAGEVSAQDEVVLTLDRAVDIAMDSSYRIRYLEMGIERNRYWLQARQASLKSKVYMNLTAPEFKNASEYKWNSDLGKDELIHEDTRKWQMDLSVRQPVVVLGRPTNGYLSLNSKTYRYLQKDGNKSVDFYNRYFLKYEQPFFQPNGLKNNIEDAELDLSRRELEYIRDRAWLINSVADDYYDLFEYTYRDSIYQHQIDNLETIARIAEKKAAADSSREIDIIQVKVEAANARERRLRNQSRIRQEGAGIKQRLRLSQDDMVKVITAFPFKPLNVDVEQAVQYGYTLSPTLRMLNIDKRKNEIDVDNAKGWDAFRVNLEMTYGLEKTEDRYQEMFEEYDNSYSATIRAYLPVWDWGRRKTRIEAEKVDVRQMDLRIEENSNEIRSNIIISVQNLNEYQDRTKNMMESQSMVQQVTDYSIRQYEEGVISLQDALQSVSRQVETENNFLDAYQGFRRSLIDLMMKTFYDYENDISLIDKFRKSVGSEKNRKVDGEDDSVESVVESLKPREFSSVTDD